MSLAVLLAQQCKVTVLDINSDRVDQINSRQSTIVDSDIENFLKTKKLDLDATLDKAKAYSNADFIIIATPTNYDVVTCKFDTEEVDSVVHDALTFNDYGLVVIKSTIPVGHTNHLQLAFDTNRIIFSPEFLREGQALYDNLYPSRIVIGSNCDQSKKFARLLENAAVKVGIEVVFVGSNGNPPSK